MVMADRDGVRTASVAVTAIDALALGTQMVAAAARVPFRKPLAGHSSVWENLGTNLTRELLRSFLGNLSALPVDEFRSLERLIDDICGVVLPPLVRALDVEERALILGGVPGQLYVTRTDPPEGIILYLHGGGFIGTSPRMYATFCARLSRATRCAVFVADYRLAPEFPFPAGIHDAVDVLVALHDRGAPPERVLIAGDSAGGGLANAVLLSQSTNLPHMPAGLILLSPEVDLRLEEPSFQTNAASDVVPWNIPTSAYLHGEDAGHIYFEQHQADLSAFPPTFVSWGADEMFRDPIRLFVERLRTSGVAYEAHEAEGMFHAFQIVLPWAEETRAVYHDLARFTDHLLDGAPPLPPGVTRG